MSSGLVSKPPGAVSVAKVIRYAVPSGEMATHGSEARSKFPPFAGVPPVQFEDLVRALIVQVAPPSRLVAVTLTSAPPLFQRFCCQAPMMTSGFDGSTITWGSTSLLTNCMAGTPPTSRNPVSPSQAAIGLAPDTVTSGPVVDGTAVAGTELITASTATDVPNAMTFLLERCMRTPSFWNPGHRANLSKAATMFGYMRRAAARAPRWNRSTKPRTRSDAGARSLIATMRPSRRSWASYTSAILPRLTSSRNSQSRRERPWCRPPNDCTPGNGRRCPGVVDSAPHLDCWRGWRKGQTAAWRAVRHR